MAKLKEMGNNSTKTIAGYADVLTAPLFSVGVASAGIGLAGAYGEYNFENPSNKEMAKNTTKAGFTVAIVTTALAVATSILASRK